MRKRLLALLALALLGPAHAQVTAALEPGSTVTYRAADPRGSFEGRAPVEGLELRFDPAAPQEASLRVVVRPERFASGIFIRDVNAQRTVFETAKYPEASFVLTSAAGPALPEAGSVRLSLSGELTLHGVTRPLEVEVQLERSGEALRATGSFELLLSNYGMRRPSFLFWTVDDRVEVRFALALRLAPASGAPQ